MLQNGDVYTVNIGGFMVTYLLADEPSEEARALAAALRSRALAVGGEFRTRFASEMRVAPCIGCFSCWIKTPGLCVFNDEGRDFMRDLVSSDELVLLTKIPFGSFSPPLKRVLDRMLPSLLPDFRIFRGEMHHQLRYKKLARLLHVSYGDCSAAERDTFLALSRAHADNDGSPRLSSPFHLEASGERDANACVKWIESEAKK
jgi:multimeric flavodoxin WrbA